MTLRAIRRTPALAYLLNRHEAFLALIDLGERGGEFIALAHDDGAQRQSRLVERFRRVGFTVRIRLDEERQAGQGRKSVRA